MGKVFTFEIYSAVVPVLMKSKIIEQMTENINVGLMVEQSKAHACVNWAARFFRVRSQVQGRTRIWPELSECIFVCFNVPVASRRLVGRTWASQTRSSRPMYESGIGSTGQTSKKSDFVRFIVSFACSTTMAASGVEPRESNQAKKS